MVVPIAFLRLVHKLRLLRTATTGLGMLRRAAAGSCRPGARTNNSLCQHLFVLLLSADPHQPAESMHATEMGLCCFGPGSSVDVWHRLAPRTVPSPNPRCRVQRGHGTLWLFGQSVVLLLWWARSTPLPPHRDAPPLTRLIATHLGRHRAGEHAYTGSCSLKPSAMATCGTARARSLEAACQFILLPRPIREREGVVGTAGAQRAIAADAPSAGGPGS